ncbi:unnamed protein product [Prunus armeniaca]
MFTSPNIRASHLRIVKGRLAYTKMLTMTVYGWLEMLTAEDRAGSELLSNEIVKAEHDAEITKRRRKSGEYAEYWPTESQPDRLFVGGRLHSRLYFTNPNRLLCRYSFKDHLYKKSLESDFI